MGNCKYLHFGINLIGLSIREAGVTYHKSFKKFLHLTYTKDLYLDTYMEY